MSWSALWRSVPDLTLCIVALLMLRRQTVSHKLAMAKLDALKGLLEELDGDCATFDPSAPCGPQHDPLPGPETKARSRLRSIEDLLRRR